MQKHKPLLGIKLFLFILLIITNSSIPAQSDSDVWVTAYYAGWMQGQTNNGHLPAQDIDYSAVTHIVHFALVPNSNGTLDDAANSVTQTNSAELISRAHANGVKVLISVGGWNSGDGFIGATSLLNLTTFVANLVNFMTTRGYDGIDLDWEPLRSTDGALYIALVTALRTAMDIAKPGALLTAANGSEADIFAQVHQHFDQINLMTYDMSGPWPGWVTWHNSPVYNGGEQFPCCAEKYLPSADALVDAFIAEGIPANKIGIGIDFYGYIWNGGDGTPTGGVTKPRQEWTVEPWMQGNVPYHSIMDNYYQPQYYGWDDNAKGAYLGIDKPGSSDDKFISYDDEQTVQAKFDYARSKGIGGLIVWEIGGGYRPNMPQGQRDPLLQAVKNALLGEPTSTDDIAGLPDQFRLEQNYPNPFNPSTTIQFTLPNSSHVELNIYNIVGEKIAVLVNEVMGIGTHNITWDVPNNIASGIYIYSLRSGNNILVKKMALTK